MNVRLRYIVLGFLLLFAINAGAATNELSGVLQKGLFEEEANHDLESAIRTYQSLITQYDNDRKVAATAIFRLGECYRKQGKDKEARAQYERVIRDFSEQTTLVELSMQHLRPGREESAIVKNTTVDPLRVERIAWDGTAWAVYQDALAPSNIIVLDNLDAAFTGSWTTAGPLATNKYGGDYKFASTTATSEPTSTATYRPSIRTAGRYDIDVWYPEGPNRATNAQWLIACVDGMEKVSVNQRVNGGQWNRIAYNKAFAAGREGFIQLMNNTGTTGAVVTADGVRLVPARGSGQVDESAVVSDYSDPLVIDNSVAQFNGDWARSTIAFPGLYGGDHHSAMAVRGTPTATAIFRPNIPEAGKYDVYIRYVTGPNRSRNTQWLVVSADGQITTRVDQRINGAQWVPIAAGKYFAKGTEGYVQLSNHTDDAGPGIVVIADAVRFVPSEEFEALFNGEDLTGWKGDPTYWSVSQNTITAQTPVDAPANLSTCLVWQEPVGDFELRFKFKFKMMKSNSQATAGVIYRGKKNGENDVLGYECRLSLGGESMGMLGSRERHGMISFMQTTIVRERSGEADKVDPVRDLVTLKELLSIIRKEDWNEFVIVARGNHFIHKINGNVVAEMIDENGKKRADSGLLALQLNTGSKPAVFVQFKDIKLRRLSGNQPATETPTTVAEAGTSSGATEEEEKEIRRIKALIKDSPDLINAVVPSGKAPLHLAAEAGQLAAARFLLDNGADVNVKSPLYHQKTPLHFATEQGHKSMVELLLSKGAEVDARMSNEITPLHQAAGYGFRAVSEILLQSKADVNAKNRSSETPLHQAIARGHKAAAELLISAGADVNARTERNQTPLHYAVIEKKLDMARLLIASKADVNLGASDDYNNNAVVTPLHIAVASKDEKMAELLLQNGAKTDLKITWKCPEENRISLRSKDLYLVNGRTVALSPSSTPLHQAVLVNGMAVAEILLKYGANPNATNNYGETPLYLTATNQALIESLIAQGANVNARDINGASPLHFAVSKKQKESMEVLLRNGADVNAQDSHGDTPLHSAAPGRRREILETLLVHKADLNIKNKKGQTPLGVAIAQKSAPVYVENPGGDMVWDQVIALLKQYGAQENAP